MLLEVVGSARERLGTGRAGVAAWALGVVGDSGSWMAGGTIVGSEVGAPSSGFRCLRVEELRSAEVVVEDPLSSISSDDAFVSSPSVMAAGFPTFCHGNHSHSGWRRMTKTTDATMSEMPSRAMLGLLRHETVKK